MLETIKQFVRRMLMGKGKGILQIAPKKDVDKFAKDLLKKFKDNGVPDEAITNTRDVKIIWEQITNREAQIMHTNLKDTLSKMDAPLTSKKSADVLDLTGKKIEKGKPIPDKSGMAADDYSGLKEEWLVELLLIRIKS